MLVWKKKMFQTCSAVVVKPISYLITCKRFPVLITGLGEIAHLPKPITPHVRFQSFVFNVLPWISASLDDLSSEFCTSVPTTLFQTGLGDSPSWVTLLEYLLLLSTNPLATATSEAVFLLVHSSSL